MAWAMRVMNFPKMASIPWDMSKGNLDDLYLRTNGLRGVLPHELPPLAGPGSGKSGPFSHGMRTGHGWAMRVMNFPKMASIPWDMSKGNLDDLYLRTNGLRGVLPHELPPLLGLTPGSGKSGPLSRMRSWAMAGAMREHEFPQNGLPSLGTCPKATWMTSICEPTAYGASFPMNSHPLLGLTAANLGRFS